MKTQITRRGFLKGSGLLLAGVATPVGVQVLNLSTGWAAEASFKPNAFIELAPDESIIIWVGQTELGQGTHTGLPMVLADEMGADWKKVRVKMAGAAEPFKDPFTHAQMTGGSTSIRHRWDLLRNMGAAAREMLIQAAANQWKVKPQDCKAQEGKVINKSGKSLSFGRLCARAAKLPVPKKPTPKPAKDYTLIGTSPMRVDVREKVAGATVYGFDFKVPDMVVATVSRPPCYGAKPEAFDKKAAMAVKGVLDVVPVQDRVMVFAKNTYAALKGKDALKVKWSKGANPSLDDAYLEKHYSEELTKPGAPASPVGDAKAAMATAQTRLEATYKFPYVAHVAQEPMNCTAHVEKDRCRVWAPTQGQTVTQMVAGQITKLPADKIEVITPYVGGGFGGRFEVSVLVDALLGSKIMKRPVKAVWTREDDFKNDFYRPACHSLVQGGLDGQGRVVSWVQKIASPSIMSRVMPQSVQNGVDAMAVDGVANMMYDLPNRLVEYIMVKLPIPVGFLRSVGHTFNAFSVECFMDEMAAKAGKDPVEFRLAYLKKGTRERRLLELLAQKSGWGQKSPQGRGRGVAMSTCFGSTAAYVAEVSVDQTSGAVKVHKLVAAIDCGTAVFPNGIEAQVQGGAIMALSMAFKERVSFKDGGVATSNYNDYPLLSMTEVPEIEVIIAPDGGKTGGVGEPPVPPVAPAVANAIFNAVGVRLRELPFDTSQLKKG